MGLFKFKKSKSECPAVMHVRAPGGTVILNEVPCSLPTNHDGPHRGNGLVWSNSEALIRQWAQEADPAKKKTHIVT